MDHNSAKFNKKDLALQRILKDILGVTNRRRTGSIREDAIKRNIAKEIKSTDLSSTNSCLSATTENRFGNETEKTEENKTPPRVYSVAAFSRRKYKLDVEIEKLRKTVQRCRDSIEPLQKHVDMRLKYYQSLTRSNYLEKTKASIESCKRKKCYHDDSEGVDTDGEDSDDYDTGSWSSELDGLKIIFKKFKKEEN